MKLSGQQPIGTISFTEDGTWEEYLRYIDSPEQGFPVRVREFVRRESLHDALIESARLDASAQKVTLRLVAGDLQRGYRTADLLYEEVDLSKLDLDSLKAIVRDRRSEIARDQFAVSNEVFIHRIVVHPAGGFAVCFRRFEFSLKRRPIGRVLPFLGDPFEIV